MKRLHQLNFQALFWGRLLIIVKENHGYYRLEGLVDWWDKIGSVWEFKADWEKGIRSNRVSWEERGFEVVDNLLGGGL